MLRVVEGLKAPWVDIGGVTPGWNWSEGLLLCWPVGVVVLRAEAQVGLVVNEVGGDDDMWVVAGRCPRLHPHSPQRGLETSRGALGQRTKTLKKRGDGGGTSSRRNDLLDDLFRG